MKKTLTFILILVLMATGATFVGLLKADVGFADTQPTISGAEVTVHRGQAFTMDVSIQGNTGLTGLKIWVKYDYTAMELVDVTLPKTDRGLKTLDFDPMGTVDGSWSDQNKYRNGVSFLWSSSLSQLNADTSNGVLMTLHFESFLTAETGTYDVQLICDPDNASNNGTHVDITMHKGVVELEKGEFRVEYYDYDDTPLADYDYNDEDNPPDMSNAPTPTRKDDDMYSYEFAGWKAVESGEKNVIKYVAQYDCTPIEYLVIFVVDGDQFDTNACNYGEDIDFPNTSKQGYTFSGWYVDEDCEQRLTTPKMSANKDHVWYLYGYYTYDVREENVPEVTLSIADKSNGVFTIDAVFTVNMGVVAMNLDLNYDRDNLIFKGFMLGDVFSQSLFKPNADIVLGDDGYYRGASDGALAADPFRFMFSNGITNTTACELIVRMQFELAPDAPNGVYVVTFDYDPTRDVYYVDRTGSFALTSLNVYEVELSKGERSEWSQSAEGDSSVTVDVSSSVGMEMHTKLVVKDVSASYANSDVSAVIGSDKEIKNAYKLDFKQNNVSVEPSGELQITIDLKTNALSSSPSLYLVTSSGELVAWESQVVGTQLTFCSETLGTFVIVGNKTQSQQPPAGDNDPSGGGNPSGGNNPSGGGGDTNDGPLDPHDKGVVLSYVVMFLVLIILILIILIIFALRKKKDSRD